MSVIKSKRSDSQMEFLATARKLQAFTIHKCVNAVPKRYTFYIGTHLADSATAIYEWTKRGNSIYPLNPHEVQMRRDCFLKAYAELQSLVSQIELANEIIPFNPDVLAEWSSLINTELKMVKAVLKADRERYKNMDTANK